MAVVKVEPEEGRMVRRMACWGAVDSVSSMAGCCVVW